MFVVDVRQAGDGQLEIAVNKGSVRNQVSQVSPGIYQVSFIPQDAHPHTVDIHFNKVPIQGKTFIYHLFIRYI